jgi:ribosomal protein S27AE
MTQTCDRCGRGGAIFVLVHDDFEEYLCIRCFFEEKGVQERSLKQTSLLEFGGGRF